MRRRNKVPGDVQIVLCLERCQRSQDEAGTSGEVSAQPRRSWDIRPNGHLLHIRWQLAQQAGPSGQMDTCFTSDGSSHSKLGHPAKWTPASHQMAARTASWAIRPNGHLLHIRWQLAQQAGPSGQMDTCFTSDGSSHSKLGHPAKWTPASHQMAARTASWAIRPNGHLLHIRWQLAQQAIDICNNGVFGVVQVVRSHDDWMQRP